jgi:hypothetical protein
VALEGDAKILGGDVVALAPLVFELRSLVGEDLGEPLDGRGDKLVGLLHDVAWHPY